jgi:hypothetical protein
MDCTYKTNKFKMSLLNVVGLTSQNKSFFVGFVFLKEETEPFYVWAIDNMTEIYNGVQFPKVVTTELALMNAINCSSIRKSLVYMAYRKKYSCEMPQTF